MTVLTLTPITALGAGLYPGFYPGAGAYPGGNPLGLTVVSTGSLSATPITPGVIT